MALSDLIPDLRLYYTGKNGVYNYGGKDYKFGDELPADIPAETVEAFMAKGKMSTTRPTADAPPAPSEVELLKQTLTEVTGDYVAAQQQVSDLEQQLATAVDEGVKLSADLQTAQQTITELEKRVSELDDALTIVTTDRDTLSTANATAQQTITELTNQLTAGPAKGGKK